MPQNWRVKLTSLGFSGEALPAPVRDIPWGAVSWSPCRVLSPWGRSPTILSGLLDGGLSRPGSGSERLCPVQGMCWFRVEKLTPTWEALICAFAHVLGINTASWLISTDHQFTN